MTAPEIPHHVPRHPHRWWALLLASQSLVVAAWWGLGWQVGLVLAPLTHAPFWWGILAPRSRFYTPVLDRLPGEQPQVWLTIDDGPSDETPAMLDLLDRHQARATFFLVGQNAEARPDLVREILRRGHGIGNHSHSHPQAWFWALGPRRMAAEIDTAQHVLAEIAGSPPRWFRSVVGMTNPFVAAPLKRHGLARVAWSARGFDGVGCDPDEAVARIVRDLHPGAIVLLHEGAAHGHNPAILEGVLQAVRQRGFETVLPR